MTQIIKFYAQNEYVEKVKSKPIPAGKYLPEWFKNMSSLCDNEIRLEMSINATAKKCAPLVDSLISGYIMPLWSDLLVSQTNDGPNIKWITSEAVVDTWPWSQSSTYEIPDGFDKTVFKYFHGWNIKTPPGYSCLIIHPTGYQGLPIRTITGIIDSDILDTEANAPFVIKNGFEGIIKKGTPMFQIIPFKRERWQAEYDTLKENEHFFNMEKLRTKMISAYSSKRVKKIYR